MSGRLKQIGAAIKRHGFLNYVSRFVSNQFSRLYCRQISTVFVLRPSTELPLDRLNPDLSISEETFPVEPMLREFLEINLPARTIAERVDDQWRIMVARKDSVVLGISWFRMDSIHVESIGTTLEYGAPSGYIEGTLTSRAARGQGVAPAIRVAICQRLRELGAEAIYVCAGDDNPASQAVARKCGFEPHEHVDYRKILFFRRARRTPS